jgi:hypothetical protein
MTSGSFGHRIRTAVVAAAATVALGGAFVAVAAQGVSAAQAPQVAPTVGSTTDDSVAGRGWDWGIRPGDVVQAGRGWDWGIRPGDVVQAGRGWDWGIRPTGDVVQAGRGWDWGIRPGDGTSPVA